MLASCVSKDAPHVGGQPAATEWKTLLWDVLRLKGIIGRAREADLEISGQELEATTISKKLTEICEEDPVSIDLDSQMHTNRYARASTSVDRFTRLLANIRPCS